MGHHDQKTIALMGGAPMRLEPALNVSGSLSDDEGQKGLAALRVVRKCPCTSGGS